MCNVCVNRYSVKIFVKHLVSVYMAIYCISNLSITENLLLLVNNYHHVVFNTTESRDRD